MMWMLLVCVCECVCVCCVACVFVTFGISISMFVIIQTPHTEPDRNYFHNSGIGYDAVANDYNDEVCLIRRRALLSSSLGFVSIFLGFNHL